MRGRETDSKADEPEIKGGGERRLNHYEFLVKTVLIYFVLINAAYNNANCALPVWS